MTNCYLKLTLNLFQIWFGPIHNEEKRNPPPQAYRNPFLWCAMGLQSFSYNCQHQNTIPRHVIGGP